MKRFLTFTVMVLPILCFSQKPNINSELQVINKWKKAIVNLEIKKSFNDSVPWKDIGKLDSALKNHLIDTTTYLEYISNYKKAIYTGSSVFIDYNNKYYLVTARHVIKITEDTSSIKGDISIVRIPLEGEAVNDEFDNDSSTYALQYSPAFPDFAKQFIFSEPEVDLAIISLNRMYSDYAKYLIAKGQVPIKISEIDTSGNLDYGQGIICLGYPFFALEHFINIKGLARLGRSKYSYNIAATFGRVAIPQTRNYFFLGDISIMPGNSGGAMISNNKLVGIVSQQPSFNLEDEKNVELPYTYRLPYGYAVKAKYIIPLLHELRRRLNE